MRRPIFSLGQPVRVRDKADIYRVIALYEVQDSYAYLLRRYDNRDTTQLEHNLAPMQPFRRERTKDGRVRTIKGYFFSIDGGAAA